MLSGDLTLGPHEQHWNLTSSPVRCDFAVLRKVIFAKYNSILLLAEENESTKQNYIKRYKQHSRSYGNICISFSLVVSCFPWFVSQLCLCFFTWPRHTWVLQCFNWDGVGVLHRKKWSLVLHAVFTIVKGEVQRLQRGKLTAGTPKFMFGSNVPFQLGVWCLVQMMFLLNWVIFRWTSRYFLLQGCKASLLYWRLKWPPGPGIFWWNTPWREKTPWWSWNEMWSIAIWPPGLSPFEVRDLSLTFGEGRSQANWTTNGFLFSQRKAWSLLQSSHQTKMHLCKELFQQIQLHEGIYIYM